MAKGIKSSGKAAYVFAILPYVILITILIVALNLDGAKDGISYFLVPKADNGTAGVVTAWERLFDLKIW
jgi:solute carrier family 6 (neurotransmitter transporter, glycine) member 5/9